MRQLLGLAILVTLLSLASIVGSRDSNASKAGANSVFDLVQLRTLAEAGSRNAQYRPAERYSTGLTAEQDMAVALVWYRKETDSDGGDTASLFGSRKSDSDSGQPGGGGGNSGESGAGGSNTGGGNTGGNSGGGGNTGGGGGDTSGGDTSGGDTGGSNTGGSNTGDRNVGGSSTGGSSTGERDQGGSGQGNSGRGNTGRDR